MRRKPQATNCPSQITVTLCPVKFADTRISKSAAAIISITGETAPAQTTIVPPARQNIDTMAKRCCYDSAFCPQGAFICVGLAAFNVGTAIATL
jgi:hypothetical protein